MFGVTYVHRVQYNMACRNRNLEGTEDGQMTPCGYPNFNSYIKNLFCGITDGQTEGRTEGQMNREINPGWAG